MQYLKFLAWLWRRSETWKKLYLAGLLIAIAVLGFPPPWDRWIFATALTLTTLCWVGWIVKTVIQQQWQVYQQERNSLFDRIRDSDHNH